MNANDKKDSLGMLGERLVLRYLESQGHKVEMSYDKYDSKKDLVVDGKFCEVKTQMPWHKENSFSINPSQYKKCSDADMLFFVESPSSVNGGVIHIWDFSKSKDKITSKSTRDGRTMYLYNKLNGDIVDTITNDEYIRIAEKYGTSNSKNTYEKFLEK